jgi:uncharacterized protein YeaO (DUF488 family)
MIKVKRIYEPALPEDGKRLYVDRLWPRGLKKAEAKIDEWLKEIAPSDELRKWFGHDPAKYQEFKKRYIKEGNSGKNKKRGPKGNSHASLFRKGCRA